MYQIYPKQHGFLLEYKNNYEDSILGINFENVCAERNIICKALVEKQNTEMIGSRNRRNLYYCGRCCNWSRMNLQHKIEKTERTFIFTSLLNG